MRRSTSTRGQSQIERAEGDVLADRRTKKLVVRILEQESDQAANFRQVLAADGQPGHMDGGPVGRGARVTELAAARGR